MAETAVENKACTHCGVEVREGADFCYNCGKAVSSEAINHNEARRETTGGDIHRSNGAATKPLSMEISSKDSAPGPERKLQSAAALRRKSKSYISKPVEIEWVEPEHGPRAFVIASVVFSVLALLLLFAAFYLR